MFTPVACFAEDGSSNHDRVVSIANELKSQGLRVWIDETMMTGNIVDQMIDGIERSATVVVFVTQRYQTKVSCPPPTNSAHVISLQVGGRDMTDNCRREFDYAVLRKSVAKMVTVVMENRMSNPKSWEHNLAMHFSGNLCVMMRTPEEQSQNSGQLVTEIRKRF